MTTAHYLLNNEIRSYARSVAAFDTLLGSATDAVASGTLQKSPEARGSFFKNLDGIVQRGMAPLKSRYDTSTSRKGSPGAFEANHVVVMEEPGTTGALAKLFRLVSIRIHVANDEVVLEKLPLQAGFRFHVGQSFHLRGDAAGAHFDRIASSMLDWYYVAKMSDEILEEASIERFAVPGPSVESLLLGNFDRSAAVPAGSHHRIRKNGIRHQNVPVSPFAQGLFVANTFIGQNELRPEQKELYECFHAWHGHYAKSHSAALERECWPFKEIAPSARGVHLGEEEKRTLAAFLLERRALAAMQAIPREWPADELDQEQSNDRLMTR